MVPYSFSYAFVGCIEGPELTRETDLGFHAAIDRKSFSPESLREG